MLESAMGKIRTEMNANSKNPYVQVVGNFLIQHIEQNEKDAEKILGEDKTILKSLETMRKEAEKKKVGNVAVLTDAEGFSVVLKYFGVESEPVVHKTPVAPATITTQNDDFDVKLDDFL